MQIFWQAAALVSDPPGSLVYHLVLLFALGAVAAVAVGEWRRAGGAPRQPAAGRLALAASFLFVLRLAGIILAFLAALAVINSLVVVPPFERAASTLTILSIIWLLAFPQPQRLADALFSLLAVLVVLALVISWGLWSQQAALAGFYNGGLQETVWEYAQILMLAGGAVLLAARGRPEWRLGLVIVGLLLAGHIIHFLRPTFQSSASGIERLFEIAAVPLVAAAIYRRAHLHPAAASATLSPALPLHEAETIPGWPTPAVLVSPETTKAVTVSTTLTRPGLDSRAAVALASLASAKTMAELQQHITTAVAHALAAPVALLLLPDCTSADSFTTTGAYDLAQARYFGQPSTVRPPAEVVASLETASSVVWLPDDSRANQPGLSAAAGLVSSGPVLLTPIRTAGGPLLAILASLPSEDANDWPAEQRDWLTTLAPTLAAAWQAFGARPTPGAVVVQLEAQLEAALQEVQRLQEAAQLQNEQVHRLERADAARSDELAELETLRADLQSLRPEIEASQNRQEPQSEPDLAEPHAQVIETSAPSAPAETAAVPAQPESPPADPAAEAETLRATLAMLQPELDYYRQQEQVLQAEVERLRAVLVEQTAQPSVPAAEAETLRANLSILAGELDTYRAEQARQQAEAARLKSELEAGQQRQALIQAQLDGAQAELSQRLAQPDGSAELEDLRVEILSLQTQLASAHERQPALSAQPASEPAHMQLPDDLYLTLATSPPPADPVDESPTMLLAPKSAFLDADQGMAEMLEALAGAEARLARQAIQLVELREALAESERRRLAPPPAARSVQAADMEVIASLSQELRQPMSSIIGYVDLLLSESVGIIGALQRKFLERIKASSERIGVLLDDMMRVMDIDSGNLNLAQESVNVVQVIEDAVHGCEAVYQEKGLRLATEIAPNLPPVQADRDALLQIFSHLVSNAGAASANDSTIHLTVKHESEQRPGADPLNYLIIAVTDTGGGIAPEDQPRAFSRLYRADAPLIAGLGDNGMGLSIAKALVEGTGGRIWVISDPGQGSTFYVLLPLEGRATRAVAARLER